jgi:hypothetical protein
MVRKNGFAFMILILSLSLALAAHAQTDEEAPDGIITAEAWQFTDLDDDTAEPGMVLFLTLDEGDTLIEVAAGEDLIYTRVDDQSYSVAPLIPTDAYEYEGTLTVVDADTRQLAAVTTTGSFTFESNLEFTRTDLTYEVWSETERTVSEYSLFQECMGRTNVTPGEAWTTPDPLVPIRVDDEALYIGSKAYPGGGGSYELVSEAQFGQFPEVITETITVAEDAITYNYHAIADERDDCEMIYEAALVPFDGDYEALLETE